MLAGMSAQLIDGKAVRDRILEGCRGVAEQLKSEGIQPGLAVVIVGDDPASHAYVRSKVRTCETLGYHSVKHVLPADTRQDALESLVTALNLDPKIHGILVQSPPPPHIDESAITRLIDPNKDVDGFHPINVAKLVMDDPSGFVPCTPLGCQRLMQEAGVETRGAHAVVIGRSMLVGKPMALLLMRRGAGADSTVTVAHSRTADLPAVCRSADILIAAIGRPNFVTTDFLSEGVTIIDVGINRVDAANEKGYALVGDVDPEPAMQLAQAMTPVPGGVGPMTIAMLMRNTLKACLQASSRDWRVAEEL